MKVPSIWLRHFVQVDVKRNSALGVLTDGAKSMSRGEHRRFTAEQKLEILREAEQPGVTISEVCRRHGLAASVFYRWRAVAQGGSAVALKRDAQRTPRKDDDRRSGAENDRRHRRSRVRAP